MDLNPQQLGTYNRGCNQRERSIYVGRTSERHPTEDCRTVLGVTQRTNRTLPGYITSRSARGYGLETHCNFALCCIGWHTYFGTKITSEFEIQIKTGWIFD